MLTKEKILHYKEELLHAKDEIMRQIETDKKMLDFGDDVDSGDEKTDEAEEKGNQLAVEQVLRGRLNAIELALRKIESGTYGECHNCSDELIEKILDAAPESNLCEKCRTLQKK